MLQSDLTFAWASFSFMASKLLIDAALPCSTFVSLLPVADELVLDLLEASVFVFVCLELA